MSRALVTFGVGPHQDLLEIALPSFEEFARRHGYELIVADPIDCARPPSWWKVPALLAVLEHHSEALWLDSDIVIVDPTDDLPVPHKALQALVEHHTGDGDVPNCGVWYVRQAMAPVLRELWGLEEYLHHGWWEQAAMHQLLGYGGRPLRRGEPTALLERTHFLDNGWNVHPWDRPIPGRARFLHATTLLDRGGVMREWSEAALCAS